MSVYYASQYYSMAHRLQKDYTMNTRFYGRLSPPVRRWNTDRVIRDHKQMTAIDVINLCDEGGFLPPPLSPVAEESTTQQQ